MHRGYTGLAQHALQAEVEIRRVHADKNVGWIFHEMACNASAQRAQFTITPQHLEQPHHRQAFRGGERPATRLRHARSGDTLELNIRHTRPHGANQLRRQ